MSYLFKYLTKSHVLYQILELYFKIIQHDATKHEMQFELSFDLSLKMNAQLMRTDQHNFRMFSHAYLVQRTYSDR